MIIRHYRLQTCFPMAVKYPITNDNTTFQTTDITDI